MSQSFLAAIEKSFVEKKTEKGRFFYFSICTKMLFSNPVQINRANCVYTFLPSKFAFLSSQQILYSLF